MGTILYTPNHRMAATLGRRNLPHIVSAKDASLEELRELLGGFTAYIGAWVLDEPNGSVIHKVDYSSNGGVSGDQVRYFRFDGDRLILRSTPEEDEGAYAEVIWERA